MGAAAIQAVRPLCIVLTSVCMVMRVAITGGIACGKSLFSQILERLGAELLDADDVVHRLEEPGGVAVPSLVRLFGASVLDRRGGLDRAVLAERVFTDASARERLNAVLHPLVRAILAEWIDASGGALRIAVIPLLFEAGWAEEWDVIICLASSETLQRERLMRCRGLTEEQARRRIAAQMPVAEKAARSHLVVHNDADAETLAKEAEKIYRILTEKADEYRQRNF
jgi:dephospho-CoA kinase